MKLKHLAFVALLAGSSFATAAVIPSGIQTSVSNVQIANWGWTECSRTGAYANVSTATVLSACQGDYLAMGIWDSSLGAYGVVGIGERAIVTKVLYTDSQGDDNGTIQNWSNGLNWYRTSSYGSWGFTTARETALSTADLNMSNGLNSYDQVGTIETTLAAGLSYHLGGTGDLVAGWCYNPTGSNFQCMESSDQRVFWVANKSQADVPEPTSLALLGIGALALARRRTRK